MAGKRTRKRHQSREEALCARLELIRKRHRELILQPRELMAADLASELDDSLEEPVEADELQLAQTAATRA
jgi:hypothetical protein